MSSRRTRQRTAVLRVLTGCQDFVSAQELHTLLTAADVPIGLTTVYRALRDLEATGGVDVVRDEAGERLYRPRPADGHRHYLICRCCGRSRPVDSEIVERWADRVGVDTGFAAVEHTVELTGICGDCQPATDEGEPSPCHWEPARGRARSCAS
ncbi:Fur family transcriptional regulator [Streptomyces rhizosphaericus]|uniref:Transcriptional repressor n=1 Tax=Streptomyces rhizosphaericus TaxID=114699 RepID=A0A6G4AJZ7_9ACTN|nr:transcriptional repressor [Streptomyces rhizosphaericus]NEW73665.1 transcriptional repressor [Streptomyces rhizosphaericus]